MTTTTNYTYRNHRPLPGFNTNVFQEGGGGLGSIFSAVSRILLPSANLLMPKFARGALHVLGNIVIDQAESQAKKQLSNLVEKARHYNSKIQTGRGLRHKQSNRARRGHSTSRKIRVTKKTIKEHNRPSKSLFAKKRRKNRSSVSKYSDPQNIFG